MTPAAILDFQQVILNYYACHGRHDLPWRQAISSRLDPYAILVSELMLQQTQVSRVIPKYENFLTDFPTVSSLAASPLGAVLTAWSGLGYNRRAKFLHQAAQRIVDEHGGQLPKTVTELRQLPGVGANTAGAIVAYAYDAPVIFIETNIRQVFIDHFFADQELVDDRQILALVEATLPASDYRVWYWALMDYGSHLKQISGNAARRSASYSRQTTFQGSLRQLRGQVIKRLTEQPQTLQQLQSALTDERLAAVVDTLVSEQLITKHGRQLRI